MTTNTTWKRHTQRAEKRKDSAARRAAARLGLAVRKSRSRTWKPDDQGGYMIVDPRTGFPQAGFEYDMSAEDVLTWCEDPN
jgi:hypothetical protein